VFGDLAMALPCKAFDHMIIIISLYLYSILLVKLVLFFLFYYCCSLGFGFGVWGLMGARDTKANVSVH
jgi:hypothetical protein